jgi:DNA-binding transcriptional MerR regulator
MIEYRVDDLARRAGVSVRNVRVYQDRGLLPPPRREGRTGWYNEAHLARLALIGRMLDRGYTFATISELLTAAQSGLRVEEVLSTDVRTASPLHESRQIAADELHEMFDGKLDEADLERGVELGLTARDGDGYRVDNPVLLDAALILHRAGIPLSHTLDQTEGVKQDLDDVARRFVALITDKFMREGQDPFDTDARTVGDIAEVVGELRPLTHRVVAVLFREAMDRRITSTMEEILAQYGDNPGSATDQAS